MDITSPNKILVDGQDHDIRLDRWFLRHYPHVGKSLIYKLARKGAIRLDGKRVQASTRIKQGQVLYVPNSILYAQQQTEKDKSYLISKKDNELIEHNILYEDSFIMVVNKPAGLACQGGTNIHRNLIDILSALGADKGYKPHLVHRLDKETSGLVVLAKSPSMAAKLSFSFQQRDMKKVYLSVLVGLPRPHHGEIDLPLKKSDHKPFQKMVIDMESGQKAQSLYQILDHAGQKFSLAALSPLTGRTHQLRVHMARGLNCPILGDYKYGGDRACESRLSSRILLHAWRLYFRHPRTSQRCEYVAPLPKDFQDILHQLHLEDPSKSYEMMEE